MNLKLFLLTIFFIIILGIFKIFLPFGEGNDINKIDKKEIVEDIIISDDIKMSGNNNIEIYQSFRNGNTLYFEGKYKNSYTSLDVYQGGIKAKKLMIGAGGKFKLEINIGANEKTGSRIEIKGKDGKTIYKNFVK